MVLVDIVTGASQGIGRAVAEYIASQRSSTPESAYWLILTGRNTERGEAAAEAIRRQQSPTRSNNNNSKWNALFEPCNLNDYAQVVRLKDRIAERIVQERGDIISEDDSSSSLLFTVGVLVNSAAECPRQQQFLQRPQRQQVDGSVKAVSVDRQFATNVLGYHFVTRVFQDHFVAGTTHVVNIASNWAGNLDLDDLHFQQRIYDNDTAYRQSKQCNRMLTVQWAQRLRTRDVVVNGCHPGDPCTTLSKDLGYNLMSRPPSQRGVETESPIPYLCGFGRRPIDRTVTGMWFEGTSEQPRKCQFAGLSREGQQLFEICESFAVDFPDSET